MKIKLTAQKAEVLSKMATQWRKTFLSERDIGYFSYEEVIRQSWLNGMECTVDVLTGNKKKPIGTWRKRRRSE